MIKEHHENSSVNIANLHAQILNWKTPTPVEADILPSSTKCGKIFLYS
jgi:hypothetical protein